MPASTDRKVYVTWTLLMVILILLSVLVPQSYKILPGPTLAWVMIGLGTALTGSTLKSRRLGNYGLLATIAGIIAATAVDYGLIMLGVALIGFGLFIGVGLMLVGFTTEKGIVPLGAYMLIGTVIQYLSTPSTQFLVNVTWLMLGGAAFASFGYTRRNTFAHFAGIAFIFGVLAVYILGGDYTMVGMVGLFIILASLMVSFTYMYHSLGRPPKVGEILTLAARALFTYGLRKPLDQYRVIAISIQGDIGTELVIDELLSNLEEERWHPIVMLGPTSPTEITLPSGAKLGWVSALSAMGEQNYTMLPPSNPSEVNIFISDAVKDTPSGRTPIIIGDFLDNMIPFMKEETFFRYYSDLASRVKVLNHTAVFIVKSDIHPEVTINIVKRFADVVIENREREERQKVVREVRVSNKIDNFSTEWEKIPMTSRIHSRGLQS